MPYSRIFFVIIPFFHLDIWLFLGCVIVDCLDAVSRITQDWKDPNWWDLWDMKLEETVNDVLKSNKGQQSVANYYIYLKGPFLRKGFMGLL